MSLSSEITDEYGAEIELPRYVGLCPIHGEHFYMPNPKDDETCPECPAELVIYERTMPRHE